MHTGDYAIQEVKRLVTFRDRNGHGLCDAELGNAFLRVVLESELSCVKECFGLLSQSTRESLRSMLTEFAARDYFDDRHALINDGMTPEQRRQHYRQMQSHYRDVGARLLELLDSSSA